MALWSGAVSLNPRQTKPPVRNRAIIGASKGRPNRSMRGIYLGALPTLATGYLTLRMGISGGVEAVTTAAAVRIVFNARRGIWG
jgi:hypothetical protein